MSATSSDSVTSRYEDALRGPWAQTQGLVTRVWEDRALLRKYLMIGGVVLVAGVALAFWLLGGRYVSTDDAYIQAPKLMVSTDVSGLVKDVDVKQGDTVKKGQVLFRLDPQPFQIALQQAKANLSQAALTVQSMKEDYRRMLSDVAAQQATVDLDQRNYARYASLLKENAIAPATYDQQRLSLQAARDQLAALKQTADTQLAKLGGNIDIPVDRQPQYLQAEAQVAEAQRQLDHTVVRAPFNGVVAEVDSLQPGMLIISAMSAFTTTSAVGLVGTDNNWIDAQMKETDLTHVRKGDPVSITVDTYPDCTWNGHVQTVSPVSGSAFSVLPAENASGNWVKVVQRIPVRIAVDKSNCDRVLRDGMSAVVDIDTGQRRWYRMLFGH